METSSGAMGGIVGAHLPIKGIAWGSFDCILTLAIQRIQMKC
jgi:hypothetical protein